MPAGMTVFKMLMGNRDGELNMFFGKYYDKVIWQLR